MDTAVPPGVLEPTSIHFCTRAAHSTLRSSFLPIKPFTHSAYHFHFLLLFEVFFFFSLTQLIIPHWYIYISWCPAPFLPDCTKELLWWVHLFTSYLDVTTVVALSKRHRVTDYHLTYLRGLGSEGSVMVFTGCCKLLAGLTTLGNRSHFFVYFQRHLLYCAQIIKNSKVRFLVKFTCSLLLTN